VPAFTNRFIVTLVSRKADANVRKPLCKSQYLAVQADGTVDFAQKWRSFSLWRLPEAVGRPSRGSKKIYLANWNGRE
jgi:hypothetical protein